jgi:hypothetical protein
MFVRFSSKVTPPACPVPSEKIKTFFGMITIFCGAAYSLKEELWDARVSRNQ